jgi:predicted RND superfamily exporter protein
MTAADACHEALVSAGASVSWTYLLLLAGLSTLLVSRMSSIREVAAVLLVAMTVNLFSTLVMFAAGGPWLLGTKPNEQQFNPPT